MIKNTILLLCLFVTGFTFAAVPTEVSAAATSLASDATEYLSTFVPVAAGVALALVGISWVKKFISRSS